VNCLHSNGFSLSVSFCTVAHFTPIKEHVKIEVRDGRISIVPAARAREGWGEAFAATPDDLTLDAVTGTAWDEEEWEW
jgi:hypothetical protein